jgi:hypothetical protein
MMERAGPHDGPSARRLVAASAVALGVAVAILFAAVLPAEYGIDPLGTGRALGLVRATTTASPEILAPDGNPLTPVPKGPSAEYATTHRSDEVVFELGPYEYLEYKYRLAQGAALVYSWEASAPVIHDFHGAPADGGPEVSVDKSTRARGAGSLAAPFAGMHGWYWENTGWAPVTIRLSSAGFYNDALESRSNRTQRVHTLEPVLAKPVPTER